MVSKPFPEAEFNCFSPVGIQLFLPCWASVGIMRRRREWIGCVMRREERNVTKPVAYFGYQSVGFKTYPGFCLETDIKHTLDTVQSYSKHTCGIIQRPTQKHACRIIRKTTQITPHLPFRYLTKIHLGYHPETGPKPIWDTTAQTGPKSTLDSTQRLARNPPEIPCRDWHETRLG